MKRTRAMDGLEKVLNKIGHSLLIFNSCNVCIYSRLLGFYPASCHMVILKFPPITFTKIIGIYYFKDEVTNILEHEYEIVWKEEGSKVYDSSDRTRTFSALIG